MAEKTTIEVSKATRDALRRIESYPRESFDCIIKRLLDELRVPKS